jgi:diguanylate cyclase (GGDEF)-like protein
MEARNTRGMGGRGWLGYSLVGLIVTSAYYLVPLDADWGRMLRVVVYCTVSASSAVAILVGMRRRRPAPRLPWLLLGLSQVVYASADATFYLLHYVYGSTGFPSVADVLYLSHYPLVVAALVVLVRSRAADRDVPGILDASALFVVAIMLSWLLLMGPQVRSGFTGLDAATLLAYPVMDLVLFAAVFWLIFGTGRRSASFFLLSASLLAIFTADTLYAWQQAHVLYRAGNFLDAIWLGGNLMLGAAALHPTMRRLGERAPVNDRVLGSARIAALAAAVLIAPMALVVQHARGADGDVPVFAVACGVLFLLTIARMHGLVSVQKRTAITDGLTGLHTRRFVEAQLAIEVARADHDGSTVAVFIADVDHFKSVNDRFGHPAGDRALVEVAARLREVSRPGDVLARYGGEEFALLVPEVTSDELPAISERLRRQVASSPIAVSEDTVVALTVSVGAASYPQHGADPTELVAAVDRALYAAKARGRNRVVVGESRQPVPDLLAAAEDQMSMVGFLTHVADEVDAWLSASEHSRAISRWAAQLSIELSHDESTTRNAALAGRLHDIGKIVVPEAILTKPAALSEEEWLLLRRHPDHGARLARLVPGFGAVASIIRQHHERFDGDGYPGRLAGTDIRIEARVLAVCDSWAAMRSDRPYQFALSEDEARHQLRRGRGTQFDPDVVDLFLDLHAHGRIGELALTRPGLVS